MGIEPMESASAKEAMGPLPLPGYIYFRAVDIAAV